ncbi:DUF938 domain-containing protein [Sphingomonas qomolangmaensis]|uniref:Class I SAM-dependent methyltransferase n=1 Tax=Sphingomonas qomolangmaensis TaxID=2918765 RepID=A0ABY5LAZ8_9SPHN|nr:DUF938 domain-containing protein [Sphingomonas qomolangmaensis]UUL84155.1 class I SAM-dependent methyltransferase [Sphingomonas qomolangmaensis]
MTRPAPWIADEAPSEMSRRHAPATLRNRDAIADLLATILPSSGTVLEVASGSGEHCAYFAERFRHLLWQPSDPDSAARASIDAWCAGLTNVHPALDLDAASSDWPIESAAAILCINMVHISPWPATLGLLAGAARLLRRGGPIVLYGPYRRVGFPTAPSNEAFDASLKERDARWGLRDLDGMIQSAAGFVPESIVEMPANNHSVVLRRI